VFSRLALITHYIWLFLKSFRYCIDIIKYIHVTRVIVEIFSCDFLKRHFMNNEHHLIAFRSCFTGCTNLRPVSTSDHLSWFQQDQILRKIMLFLFTNFYFRHNLRVSNYRISESLHALMNVSDKSSQTRFRKDVGHVECWGDLEVDVGMPVATMRGFKLYLHGIYGTGYNIMRDRVWNSLPSAEERLLSETCSSADTREWNCRRIAAAARNNWREKERERERADNAIRGLDRSLNEFSRSS